MNKKLIKKMSKEFTFKDGYLDHPKGNIQYSGKEVSDYLNSIDEKLCIFKDNILYFNIDVSPGVINCTSGKIFTKRGK